MKRASWILGVLTVLLPISPLLGEEPQYTWQSLSLRGRVRTLTEIDVAQVTAEKPDGESFNTKTTTFSTDGHALSIDEGFSPYTEHTILVWQGGWVIAQHHWDSDNVRDDVTYAREADGRVREVNTYFDGILSCQKTYRQTYPDEEIIESCEGSPTYRWTTRAVDATETHLVSWYSRSPTENGWVLQGQYEARVECAQDGATREVRVERERSLVIITDKKGRRIEETHDWKTDFHRMTWAYDDMDRLVEVAEWARDGGIVNRGRYVYTDDSNGNWIKKIEFFWSPALGAPVRGEVTIRNIEYY